MTRLYGEAEARRGYAFGDQCNPPRSRTGVVGLGLLRKVRGIIEAVEPSGSRKASMREIPA